MASCGSRWLCRKPLERCQSIVYLHNHLHRIHFENSIELARSSIASTWAADIVAHKQWRYFSGDQHNLSHVNLELHAIHGKPIFFGLSNGENCAAGADAIIGMRDRASEFVSPWNARWITSVASKLRNDVRAVHAFFLSPSDAADLVRWAFNGT